MKSSQIFLECERFLKRALKDKGQYTKGAVIAFLITGGIGVSVPSTVHAVVPTNLLAKAFDNLGLGSQYGGTTEDERNENILNSRVSASKITFRDLYALLYHAPLSTATTTTSGGLKVNQGYVTYQGNNITGGEDTTVTGAGAIALGGHSQAVGTGTLALGEYSRAQGSDAMALGLNSTATATEAVALGHDARSKSDYSLALGSNSAALGQGSNAVGYNTNAGSTASLAIGYNTFANATTVGSNALGTQIANETGRFSAETLEKLDNYNMWATQTKNAEKALAAARKNPSSTTADISKAESAYRIASINKDAAKQELEEQQDYQDFINHTDSTVLGTKLASEGTGGISKFLDDNFNNNAKLLKDVKSNVNTIVTPNGSNSIAIGNLTMAEGNGSIAQGVATAAKADASIALGAAAQVTKNATQSIAIGVGSQVYKAQSIAMGVRSTAVGEGDVAIGHGSETLGDNSVAIGRRSSAHSDNATAIGASTRVGVNSENALSMGYATNVGSNAKNSIAIGTQANVADDKTDSIAIGTTAYTLSKDSVSLGNAARVNEDAEKSVAIGASSVVKAVSSVALGEGAIVDEGAKQSIAIGKAANAIGKDSLALGTDAKSRGTDAIVIGNSAVANNKQSIVIGKDASANRENSVVLGTGSTDYYRGRAPKLKAGANPYANYTDPTTVYEYDSTGNVVYEEQEGANVPSFLPRGTEMGKQLKKLDSLNLGTVSVGGGEVTIKNDSGGTEKIRALRRITNVAPGALDTDAVTVAQLRAWRETDPHFLSVNNREKADERTTSTIGWDASGNTLEARNSNYLNDQALGSNNMALGKFAKADKSATSAIAIGAGSGAYGQYSIGLGTTVYAGGTQSIAIGSVAKARGQNSLAMGLSSEAVGKDAMSVGALSNAREEGALAIGGNSDARKMESIALGRTAYANGTSGIAIGKAAKIGLDVDDKGKDVPDGTWTGTRTVAIGEASEARRDQDVAIGYKSVTKGGDGVSIGSVAKTNGENSIAIGSNAKVEVAEGKRSGTNSIAMGRYAKALEKEVIAIGTEAKAEADSGVAIGKSAQVSSSNSVALGREAKAQGGNSIAIGYQASTELDGSNNWQAVAVGQGAKAKHQNTTALGGYAQAYAQHSTAVGADATVQKSATGGASFGKGATVSAANGLALGYGASAGVEGSVALGAESVAGTAANTNGWDPATSRRNYYANAVSGATASKSGLGSVSVGAADKLRQITNLSAGTQDTDAVNVAQLKAVNLKIAGNTTNAAGADVRLHDQTLTVQGDGTFLTSTANNNTITMDLTQSAKNTLNSVFTTTFRGDNNGVVTPTKTNPQVEITGSKANEKWGSGTDRMETKNIGTFASGNKVFIGMKSDLQSRSFNTYKYDGDTATTEAGPSMSYNGINMNDKPITNLQAGVNPNDAVNKSQLDAITWNLGAKGADGTISRVVPSNDANKRVDLVGTDGISVTASGSTVTISGSKILDSMPVVYTDDQGNRVYKHTDGNFYKTENPVAGKDKPVTNVQASLVNTNPTTGKTDTTTPTVFNNVGSVIQNQGVTGNTAPTFTDRLNVAATNNPNAAVNVKDLNSTVTDLKNKELHITPMEYTPKANGDVTLSYSDGNGSVVPNTKATIKGVAKNDLSNITDAGKKVITGLGTTVTAGKNITVTATSDNTTGQKSYAIAAADQVESVTTLAAAPDDENIATVNVVKGSDQAANARYGVGVSKKKVAEIAQDAVEVKAADGSDNVTVTPDKTAAGKTVYKVAVDKTKLGNGTNTTVTGAGTTANPYTVNVQGNVNKITSITNEAGSGKVSFDPNGVSTFSSGTTGDKTVTINGKEGKVIVGNNGKPVTIDGSTGHVTGLQNTAWDVTNPVYVSGRAATEDQLKALTTELNKKSSTDYRLVPNPDTADHAYTVDNAGEINLTVQDANGTVKDTVTLKDVASKTALDALVGRGITLGGDNNSATDKQTLANDVKFNITGDTNYITTTAKGSDVKLTFNDAGLAKKADEWKLAVNGAVVEPTDKKVNLVNGDNIAITKEGDGSVKVSATGLAKEDLSNITNEGKKAITDLGTEITAGDRVTIGNPTVDATTGKKTYTITADKQVESVTVATLSDTTDENIATVTMVSGNDKEANARYGVGVSKKAVENIAKGKDISIENKEYEVTGTEGKVELTYVDGNGKAIADRKATIKGVAKNDLSNITNEGKKVITGLGTKIEAGEGISVGTPTTDPTTGQTTYTISAAKTKLVDGTNTTVEGEGTEAKPYKVNVKGNLGNITSITNTTGTGKVSFAGDGVVKVDGDHPVSLDGKKGQVTASGIVMGKQSLTPGADGVATTGGTAEEGNYVTGLGNKTWNVETPSYVSGRAATEDQLKTLSEAIKAKTGSDYRLVSNADGSNYKVADNNTVTLTVEDASNPANKKEVVIEGIAKSQDVSNLKEQVAHTIALGDGGTGSTDAKSLKDGNVKFNIKGDNNYITTAANGSDVTLTFNDSTLAKKADEWKLAVNGTVVEPTDKKVNLVNGDNIAITKEANGSVKVSATGLAKEDLSNITNAGKKNITALGTEITAGERITVGEPTVDATTGKKTYTITADKQVESVVKATLADTTDENIAEVSPVTGAQDAANTKYGVAVSKKAVEKIAKGQDISIENKEYEVTGTEGKVELTYVDGNGKAIADRKATIKGVAKNDLSNITNEGKKVITGLGTKIEAGEGISVGTPTVDTTTGQTTYTISAAKTKLVDGTNTTVEGKGTEAEPYKVNVAGNLGNISSITNGAGSGKVTFDNNGVVKVDGDHPVSIDGKQGYVTGLQNTEWNVKNPVATLGRAATEDQLKAVNDEVNNKADKTVLWDLAVNNGTSTDKVEPQDSTVAGQNKRIVLKGESGVTVKQENGVITIGAEKGVDNDTVTTVASSDGSITVTPDADNAHKYDVKVNTDKVSETQAFIYVDENGNQVFKHADGKFYDNKGKEHTGPVHTKVNTAAPQRVDNVGSAIDPDGTTTGDTFLGKLTEAAADPTKGKSAVNVSDLKQTSDASIAKAVKEAAGNELHIKPTTDTEKYAVDANGDVTLTYVNGNGETVANTKAVISGVAKNDLSNITDAGKKVITGLGTKIQAGEGISLGTPTVDEKTGQTTYTISADKQVESVVKATLADTTDENIAEVSPVTGAQDAANTKYGVSVSKKAVENIAKGKDISIENKEYEVTGTEGKVELTYVDGNGKAIADRKATIKGVAKNDLSNITDAGKTIIQDEAKKAVKVIDGKNTTVREGTEGIAKTYAVDVKGDVTEITSITNTTGTGKVSFAGDGIVKVDGDKAVSIDGKQGQITGLQNTTLNVAGFGTSNRAATEEQLKAVKDIADAASTTDFRLIANPEANSNGVYKPNDGTIALKVKDTKQPNSTPETITINDVASKQVLDEVKANQWDLAVKSGTTITNVTPQPGAQATDNKRIAIEGKDGVTVTQENGVIKIGAEKGVDNDTVTTVASSDESITVTADADNAHKYDVKVNTDKVSETQALIYVDENGNQVFKHADGKFYDNKGKEHTGPVHTKVNTEAPQRVDNVGSAIDPDGTTTSDTFLGKLTEAAADPTKGKSAVNVSDLKQASDASIAKAVKEAAGNELHIKPTTDTEKYTVDANGDVTLTYVNGNGETVANTKAVISGVAKNDLSNITNEGKKNITALGTEITAGERITMGEPTVDATTGKKTYTITADKQVESVVKATLADTTDENIAEVSPVTGAQDAANTKYGVAVSKKAVEKIAKGQDISIENKEYEVTGTEGKVELTYVDGNGKAIADRKATIKGVAKNDLSNITNEGKKVITGLGTKIEAGEGISVGTPTTDPTTGQTTYTISAAKTKLVDGTNTTVEGKGTEAEPYKVNVTGNLGNISSITNGAGSGKVTFDNNGVVKVDGDHPVSIDGKQGYVTGLQNTEWNVKNPVATPGRAATEDQLKAVNDEVNNKADKTALWDLAVNNGTSTDKVDPQATGTEGENKRITLKGSGAVKVTQENGVITIGAEKGTDNDTITTVSNADGTVTVTPSTADAHAYDVKVNKQAVVDGAQLPVVYTTKDGKKVTIDKDGKFHTADGAEVAPGNVETRLQSAAKDTTKGDTILNNVGSAIANTNVPEGAGNKQNPTFLERLEEAAKEGKYPNAAVNVSDLKQASDASIAKAVKEAAGKELHIKPTTDAEKYTVDVNGDVTLTYVNGNGEVVADTKAVISGVAKNDLSNITDAGKKVITGLGTKIQAGEGISVGTPTVDEKTGQTTYTISADKQVESVTKADAEAGDENIATVTMMDNTVDKTANARYGVGVSKKAVANIAKDAVEVKAADGADNVTVDKDTNTEGKTIYKVSVAKTKLAAGTNTTVEGKGTEAEPYKVNVTGNLGNISSITNGAGSGKVTFDNNGVVKVDGDHPVSIDGKQGYVTGLQNTEWNVKNPVATPGRAATEDQLKAVNDEVNNKADKTALWDLAVNNGTSTDKVDPQATGTEGENKRITLKGSGAVKVTQENGVITIGAEKGTDNDTITTVSNTDGTVTVTPSTADAHAYDVKVNKQAVVDGAQLPVVYTTKDGKKVTIDKDDKFHTADGVEVAPENVETRVQSAAKDTTKGDTIFNNVGSAIANTNVPEGAGNKQNPTFLERLAETAKEGNHPNAAVNVSDLKQASDASIAKAVKEAAGNELHIKPTTDAEKYTVDANGDVTLTYVNGNGEVVADTKAVISGVAKNDLSNITDAGKKVITGLGTKIQAGEGISVGTPTVDEKTGQTTYTISADKQVESVTKADAEAGDENIATVTMMDNTVDKTANARYGVGVSKKAVANIAKDAVEVKAADGADNVTVDKDTNTEGKTIYKVSVAKTKLAAGTNTTVEGKGTEAEPYKVNVTGNLGNISSITNGAGSGKVTFDNNGVVKVDGDHPVSIDGKQGYVTGLQNTEWNVKNPVATPGRAATEDQLKAVNDEVNNKADKTALWDLAVNNGTSTDKVDPQATGTEGENKRITLKGSGAVKVTQENGVITIGAEKGTDNDTITTVSNADGTVTVTPSTADAHAYDVKVNKQAVVDGAQLPVVYTTKDGKKVTIDKGGKFHTADGVEVAPENVETRLQSAAKDTTKGDTILNNVGSAIANTNVPEGAGTKQNPTFLERLVEAAKEGNHPNAAVNVSDLKQASNESIAKAVTDATDKGMKYGANLPAKTGGDSVVTNKLGSTVSIVGTADVTNASEADKQYDGNNVLTSIEQGADGNTTVTVKLNKDLTSKSLTTNTITVKGDPGANGQDGKDAVVTVGEKGEPGKDGSDGKIGVNGKDGSAVVINGKDGSIGLTGPKGADGQPGKSINIGMKDGYNGQDGADGVPGVRGEKGVDGKDGITRIVYTEGGKEHQVATMDDGLRFTGNNSDTENKHRLNTLVNIVGEGVAKEQVAGFQSASGNILVAADGKSTLTVKMNKNLANISNITNGENSGKVEFKDNGVTTFSSGNNDANGTDTPVVINGKDGKVTAGTVGLDGKAGTVKANDITVGKQSVTPGENGVAPATGGTPTEGNFITGLDNKDWNVASPSYVSGRAATEDQLKKISEAISAKSGSDYRLVANKEAGTDGKYKPTADGDINLTVEDPTDATTAKTVTITDVAKKSELDTVKGQVGNTIALGDDTATGTTTAKSLKDGNVKFNIKGDGNYISTAANDDDVTVSLNTKQVAQDQALIYVDNTGKQVFKQPDGTFKDADGNAYNGDVHTKVNTPDAKRVDNVGSAIDTTVVKDATNQPKQDATYLEKLEAAAKDPVTGKSAVNVSDLKQASDASIAKAVTDATDKGMKYGANLPAKTGGDKVVTNKLGSTVNIVGSADVTNATEADKQYDGKNVLTSIEQDADGNTTVTVKLNKDLTSKSLTTNTVTVKGDPGTNGQDGKDAVVTVGEKGENGKDGSNGTIGVNGKDGSAVVINGKDGSIGMNGRDGANGLTMKGDKGAVGLDGTDGANGKDGMTRIVYETKHTNPDTGKETIVKHEVATMNDGQKYSGDNYEAATATKAEANVINKKLNERLEIVGGADKDKLTDNNIGVNAKDGKLKVQLASELTSINSITNKEGNGKVEFKGDGVTTFSSGATAGDKTVSIDGKAGKVTVGTGGNPVVVDGSIGDITGLTNKTIDAADFGTKGRAATEEQLKLIQGQLGNGKLSFGANLGVNGGASIVENKLGSTVNIVGTANVTADDNYDGNNVVTTVEKGTDDNTTVTVKLNKDLTSKSLTTNTITVKGEPGANGQDGKDAVVTVGEKGEPGAEGKQGKPGSDGVIGVNGKDGSAVVINGKDGSIGLTGPKGENGNSVVINGKDGKIGAKGEDGKSVVINGKDGTIGLTGPKGADGTPGKSLDIGMKNGYNGQDGADGVPGVRGEKGVDGKDGITRMVYTTKEIDPVTKVEKVVERQVATMDDGLQFAGNNSDTVNKHRLNTLVNIVGEGVSKEAAKTFASAEGNILVDADGKDKLTLRLNKHLNLTNDGSMTVGNSVVNNAGLTVKEGANESKVGSTGATFTDGTNTTEVGPTLTRVNGVKDANGTVTGGVAIGKQTVTPSENGVAPTTGGTPTTGNFVTGLENKEWDVAKPTFVSGRAATEDQLKAVSDAAKAVANNTIQFGADNASKTDTQALNKQGGIAFNITGGADKDKLSDNNIGVNANGSTVEVKLAKELKGLTSAEFTNADGTTTTKVEAGKVTTTDGTTTTVTGPNGITITPSSGTGPSVSLTNAGLNNGGNKITNVAEGTADTDAVNVSQLKSATNNIVNTGMKYGANLGVDGKPNVVSNKLGSTLNIVGTANVAADDNYDGNNVVTTVKQTDDGNTTVTVKLNKDLTSKSVTTNTITVKGEPGKDGKPSTDAVVTVGEKGEPGANGKDGKPGSDGIIGVNGKDGSAVVINGKDGSIGASGKDGKSVVINGKDGTIGLTGPKGADGKPGKSINIGMKDGYNKDGADGKPDVRGATGVDGKDGITRIVYTEGDKEHQVATMDDGVKYAGDDAQGTDKSKVIAKKLNQTVDIVGGADKAKLTDKNIGVNNVDGKLKVQLASDLTNINSITNKENNGKVEFKDKGVTTFSGGKADDKAVSIDGKQGFVTGLENKTWNVANPTVVSGRAATEDQLKVVSDRLAGARKFTGDNKGVTAVVGLGDVLNINGGADATKLTDNNIGVIAKEAEKNADGTIKTPASMTVKLAKNVHMGDGSTDYTGVFKPTFIDKDGKVKPVTDEKTGKPVELPTTVKHDGTGSEYTVYRPGKDGKPEPAITTNVTPLGVVIESNNSNGKANPAVTLTANGLDNGGNRITNVAPGINGTDGVNVDQLKVTANNVLNQATGEAHKAGARAAALAALKPLQYDPLEPTQIMAGIGNYRSETAAAVGIAHYTQEATMFHVGVTLGQHQNMVNAGVTHKFGWSPEEKAIPERYKAGPISSVYVMQDEVSALKQENERTKVAYEQVLVDNANMRAENQEMKESYNKMAQDNEEMKAQIKMLMQAMGMK